MTQQEYEQNRHDCWIRFKTETMFTIDEDAFKSAFDRAYALGKLQASCGQVKEAISQEEVEKVAEAFATPPMGNGGSFTRNEVKKLLVKFVQLFLGKQEEDTDSFEIGDKVRVKGTNQIGAIIEPYSNDAGYRVYFNDGDGGEDAEFSAEQLELYKKIIVKPKDADTVISGWVCRDKYWQKDIFPTNLFLAKEKPGRNEEWETWVDMDAFFPLNTELFPDITWDDDPIEVELIIKRKKNG